MGGTSKKKTKVQFREGFTFKDKNYGWMNGELYYLKENKVGKVRVKKDNKGPFFMLSGCKKRMSQLNEITTPINYIHIDEKRNWNAFRPAFKKDSFGIEPGTPFKEMNQERIYIQQQ